MSFNYKSHNSQEARHGILLFLDEKKMSPNSKPFEISDFVISLKQTVIINYRASIAIDLQRLDNVLTNQTPFTLAFLSERGDSLLRSNRNRHLKT